MLLRMSYSIRSIIEKGGGPKGLHEHSKLMAQKRRKGRIVPLKTIYSWTESGIPERHWWWVAPACSVTPEQLHKANEERRVSQMRVCQTQCAA
jgi:hypothetical protein